MRRRYSNSGETPLHRAAGCGNVAEVDRLLASGANAKALTRAGRSALHSVAMAGDGRIAKLRLKGHRGRVAWRLARLAGDVELFRWIREQRRIIADRLIAAGAPLNQQDCLGLSALHLAAEAGRAEIVETMLAAGANPNARSNAGFTPLHRAGYCGSVGVMRMLITHGAEVNAGDRQNLTPLHEAVRHSRREAVEVLLAHGASMSAATLPWPHRSAGETPLYCAAQSGKADIVEALLKAGADPNLANEHCAPPLHVASSGEVAERLVAAGANLASDGRHGSPLWYTVMNSYYPSHRAAAAVLLAHGVDPNVEDNSGRSLLMIAAGNEDLTALLIRHGARPTPSSRDGHTPMHAAAASHGGTINILQMLLAVGDSANARDEWGYTPLHSAAASSDEPEKIAIARFLIQHGADPAARTRAGQTPMDRAMGWTRKEKTPLDCALEHKHVRMAEFLRDAMAGKIG